MNPMGFFLLPVTALWLTLLASGCHQQPSYQSESREGGPEHAAEGVTFQKSKGLHVPPRTAQFIGLRVEDVTERTVRSTFQFNAQVYRAADEAQFASHLSGASTNALASGQVNQTDAATLQPGQEVKVETRDGKSLRGRVAALHRSLGKESTQVEVLLALADEPSALRRGTLVTATADTGLEQTVVAVPKSALLRTAEGNFVYTVSGERFVRAPVKLGGVNHEFAAVTDGLYAGDQVVVNPVMTLWLAELQSIRGGKACADGH